MTTRAAPVDVLVIGAGQAGLAAAGALRDANVDCVVHERHARVGDSWRDRYESLVLFTPRAISALPGLRHAGDPRGYPSKDEMGDYLERYARELALPVVTGDGIARLSRDAERFVARSDAGRVVAARSVVIATGGFERPLVPAFARNLGRAVAQFDARSYRNPSSVPPGEAIVVGDGATGRQIALELRRSRPVTLATGRRRRFTPQTVLGEDTNRLALRVGLLTADKRSPVGRLVRLLDATPGLHLRSAALARRGVSIAPRCVGAERGALLFADGSRRRCDAVVWALGYRDDTDWVHVEGAVTTAGRFAEDRGVAPVAGLYYVGREWQSARASGLVCGVHRDAERVARLIARRR